MVNLYRIFGALVLAGSLATMGMGWAGGGSKDQIPSDVRSSPGAYRSYFILYGGK